LHHQNTEIIWAPPGILKGSVAGVLEHVKHKILICVTNESSLTDIIMDLEELCISPDSGDVVVLNNVGQESIKKYEKFLMHHQSQELYCFLSQSSALKSMASLLDLTTYYHISCANTDSCARCSKPGLLIFSIDSFKEKFATILSLLLSSLVYLKSHAAVFSFPEPDNIEKLMNVLTKFGTLLYDENQRDDYIGAAFGLGPPAAINAILVDNASTIAWSLNEERMSCIKLIESIKSSLHLPVLENRDAIDRFCIKHSRIIVATLDCTWQLHGVDKDAFDILLVHSAGQIREDQLLASFLLPVRHTMLCGDHLHLQPFVQRMVCFIFLGH
jgi:senataxin